MDEEGISTTKEACSTVKQGISTDEQGCSTGETGNFTAQRAANLTKIAAARRESIIIAPDIDGF